MPQTSQSWTADERGGGSAVVADDEAGADADAVDEVPPSITPTHPRAEEDAAEEGVVGEEGVVNDGVVEVDGPVAALGGFPPFFFVMGWCAGVLEARWAVAGAVAASVTRTRGPSAEVAVRATNRNAVPLCSATQPEERERRSCLRGEGMEGHA